MVCNAHEQPLSIDGLVALEGDMATVRTASPRPPGARVSFQVGDAIVHGKVTSLQKSGDTFLLHVRLHTLKKTAREQLIAAVKPGLP